ncbi:MAG: hypothetical protein U0235_08405 [Polyangiaceae bacterium]
MAETILAGNLRRSTADRHQDGDYLFFQFGKESVVQTVMANLRVHLASSR